MSTIYPINYSFSGADCKAFAEVGNNTIHLQGLSTISISVHEAKSPVRRLGHRGAVAYTKAIRTIAGSMVFVLLNGQHPLQQVIDASDLETPKSKDTKKWSTGINKFNIQLSYATEYVNTGKVYNDLPKDYEWINDYFTKPNATTEYKIKGIHLLNDGFVTSINDLVSEVVIQFTALDIQQMKKQKNLLQLSKKGAKDYDTYLDDYEQYMSTARTDEVNSRIIDTIYSEHYQLNKPLSIEQIKKIIQESKNP